MSARVLISWPSFTKLGPSSSSTSRMRRAEGNPPLQNHLPLRDLRACFPAAEQPFEKVSESVFDKDPADWPNLLSPLSPWIPLEIFI